MDYTEETMIELAELIDKEQKLINGLKNSDKKRFAQFVNKDSSSTKVKSVDKTQNSET